MKTTAKQRLKKYAMGGDPVSPPSSSYRDPYYEASARLVYYKSKLNDQLKAKDAKAYTDYFKGLKGVTQGTSLDQLAASRAKYIQDTPYDTYLSPKEVKQHLGDDYDEYINSLETVNKYNKAQGMQPLYGDVEGENDVRKLNYGRRFASLQLTPTVSVNQVDPTKNINRRYDRSYEYNPDNKTVSYKENGDLDIRPSYLKPPEETPKMANGGVAGASAGGGGWMQYAQMIPQIANSAIDLIEHNPNAYSRQPTLNADTMRQMVTPYGKQYAFGGDATNDLDDETLSQLKEMADNQGISIDELMQHLEDVDDEENDTEAQGESDEEEGQDMYGDNADTDQFAYGGIHIKKANRGKFTASANRAGMGVQAFASKVLANKDHYSSQLVKRAQFAKNASHFKHAFGGTADTPIEVEGNEVMQSPDGSMVKVKGPSHENGGVPVNVPEGTKIYSDRLKIDGKSMQERKIARERAVSRVAKALQKNPTDKILQDTHQRTLETTGAEEAKDMKIQKILNAQYNEEQQPQAGYGGEYAYGGGVGDPLFPNYSLLGDDGMNDGQMIFGRNPKGVAVNPPNINTSLAMGNPPAAGSAYINPGLLNKNPATSNNGTSPYAGEMTAGDYVGMAGNLFNAIAPIVNTRNNAAGNKPNVNRFLGFGHNALEDNQIAQDSAGRLKASELTDLETAANTARLRNRNSTQSVNTLRALDAITDVGSNKAKQAANDSFEKTMIGLMGQRGQLENAKDTMEMRGEAARDMEDKADRDNFYSNMAQNLVNFGSNVQGLGKNLNTSHANKIDANMISQLSQYGLGFDDNGNLISLSKKKNG